MGSIEIVKLVLELLMAIVSPVTAIALAIFGWKKTGEIDLRKTWEHAMDVVSEVVEAIEKGADEDREIDKAVHRIESIRKKKLSPKMRGKAAARVRSLAREKLSKRRLA